MNYRKIVQIAVTSDTVYALSSDGTVWRFEFADGEWHVLPHLPQPADRPRAQPLDPDLPDNAA
jgi:hypothetical protein